MPPSPRRAIVDALGVARLGADGVAALADVVEHAHHDIRYGAPPRDSGEPARLRGVAGLAYGSVRRIARLVSHVVGGATRAIHRERDDESWARRDAVVAALNGVMGDHLAATNNPLAVSMRLLHDGHPIAEGDLPRNGRVVVLAHGLCLGVRQWRRNGHDHGAALARDLGFAPVYLEYNSGLHVAVNGRAFADALEDMVRRWPVRIEELVVVAHSMGGLVTRSAIHQAAPLGHSWPRALRRIAFLGTPHHGSHLERGGQRLHRFLAERPYLGALARFGHLRSAGITDLRHGNLLDEDRGGDGDRFASYHDRRRPVPLPAGVECHVLAAAAGPAEHLLHDCFVGDGLVPVASALGEHPDPALDLGLPADRRWVGRGMKHFDLLDRPEVYAQLAARLAG